MAETSRSLQGQSSSRGWFKDQPAGLSTLFFVELWERFSYYGMRALLVLFMVAPAAQGGLGFDVADAGRMYGTYTMAVYMLAIPGGVIADTVLGARRSVLWGGATIALGHFALAMPTITTFYLGLILIAIGTGLFKPNMSAMVGSLYAANDPRRDAGFSLFYMGINIGAFIAPLVTGFLAQSTWFKNWLASNGFDPNASWHWGFGAAALGMTLALVLFARKARDYPDGAVEASLISSAQWPAGKVIAAASLATLALMALATVADVEGYQGLRWIFLAAPLAAILWFQKQANADLKRMAAVGVLFIAAMVFWAIFEQAGISVALFADQLTDNTIAGFEFPSAWFQSLNALFVIALAPIFAATWTRLGAAQPSSPAKFAIGLLCLSASFLLMVPAAYLTATGRVSPLWLVALFFLQTVGELCLSPVGLSLMTKIAPVGLGGLIMGIWFLASAFGNKLAGVLGGNFQSSDPALLASFFLQNGLMVLAAAALLFALIPWLRRLMGDIK
jgi:proton-dependent oligopeptide transporter, POT family